MRWATSHRSELAHGAELAEARSDVAAVTRVLAALDRATTADDVAQVALDTVRDCFGWAYGSYWAVSPEDQALHRQTCRWWLIERYSSFSSVYKTLYLAAQQGVMHEFQEQFTVYGRPLLDPHAEVLA